jgi:hypothetical protein
MEPLQIERLGKQEFGCDLELQSRIASLLRPYYTNPEAIVRFQVEFNDTLYVGSKSDSIICFFFTGKHLVPGVGPTVYMGQSCVSEKHLGHGLSMLLYRACCDEMQKIEEGGEDRTVAWAKTASSRVLMNLLRVFPRVCPSLSGEYSANDLGIAHKLISYAGYKSSAEGHPLVLRGASQMRYQEQERARGSQAVGQLPWWSDLALDEAKGDRLLLLAFPK